MNGPQANLRAGTDGLAPRPLAPTDMDQVVSLIDACYREYGLVLNLDDECEQHLRDPCGYFRGHSGDFWVVPDNGRIVATVAMVVQPGVTPPTAELKSMYVDRSHRRRGMGRRLVGLVMDAARAAGCSRIELWSDTRFDAAHAMYESLGFARIGRRDIHDSNNSAEYGFQRPL